MAAGKNSETIKGQVRESIRRAATIEGVYSKRDEGVVDPNGEKISPPFRVQADQLARASAGLCCRRAGIVAVSAIAPRPKKTQSSERRQPIQHEACPNDGAAKKPAAAASPDRRRARSGRSDDPIAPDAVLAVVVPRTRFISGTRGSRAPREPHPGLRLQVASRTGLSPVTPFQPFRKSARCGISCTCRLPLAFMPRALLLATRCVCRRCRDDPAEGLGEARAAAVLPGLRERTPNQLSHQL